MEGIMNFRALAFLGFAAFVAQPALAQTASTNAASPTSVQVPIDSLLAIGYEVKAVTVMSDQTQQQRKFSPVRPLVPKSLSRCKRDHQSLFAN
jgi:hypothetical protein